MSQTLTVEIPDDVFQALEDIASRQQQSPEAAGAWCLIESIRRVQDDPIEEFIGAFATDVPGWADRHDECLGGALAVEACSTGSEAGSDR